MNFYPEIVESGAGNAPIAMYPTPGLETFVDMLPTQFTQVRGQLFVTGRLFVVCGNAFNEVFSNGTFIKRGTVENDALPVTMAASPQQLLLASAGVAYVYDLALNTLTQIPGANFSGPVSIVGICDDFFIAVIANSKEFYVSAPLDATDWTTNGSAIVSVFPDNIVGMLVDHREIWFWSDTQSVVYFDSGNVFPFDVVQGGFIETGIAAKSTPAQLANTVLWLGADARGTCVVWSGYGYTPQRVSNHAIEFAMQGYSRVDDAVAFSYQDQGHQFYVLYFPTPSKTWVYDVLTQMWHERGYWLLSVGEFRAARYWNHSFAFGRHLVGDWKSGKLYEMHIPVENGSGWDFATDDGNPIRRVRRAPHISSEQKRQFFNQLQVFVESGVGPIPPLLTGSGTPVKENAGAGASIYGGSGETAWDHPGNIVTNTPGTYASADLNYPGSGGNSPIFDVGNTTSSVNAANGTLNIPLTPTSAANEFALFVATGGPAISSGPSGYTVQSAGNLNSNGNIYFANVTTATDPTVTYGAGICSPGSALPAAAAAALFYAPNGPPSVLHQYTSPGNANLSIGSNSITISTPTTAGNALVFVGMFFQCGDVCPTFSNVADSTSDTFTEVLTATENAATGGASVYVAVANNIAGGATSATFTMAGVNSQTARYWLAEVHNLGASPATTDISQLLEASDYSFSIPSDATILGVQVLVNGKQGPVDPNAYLTLTPLTLNAAPVSKTVQLPLTDGTAIVGGTTDTWGQNWTPAQVNDSAFGFSVMAQVNDSAEITFDISGIPLLVWYTEDLASISRGPQLALRWSTDSAHTWSNEQVRDIGQAGQYRKRVRWLRLGRARDMIFEVSCSDPVGFRVVDAYLDMIPGTRI